MSRLRRYRPLASRTHLTPPSAFDRANDSAAASDTNGYSRGRRPRPGSTPADSPPAPHGRSDHCSNERRRARQRQCLDGRNELRHAWRLDHAAKRAETRPDRLSGRDRCPQDVGAGAPACPDSGRMARVTTRDPRDKKVSHERGLAGVECSRSKMAKSEMSAKSRTLPIQGTRGLARDVLLDGEGNHVLSRP
jgi:hypothetical protein